MLPWLGWAAYRALTAPSAKTMAAVVATAALATAGGHPETLAFGVLGLAAFLILEIRSRRAEAVRMAWMPVVAAAAVGFLLLGAQLLPFARLLAGSGFLQARAGESEAGGLRVFALAGQILPGFLGSPLQGEIDLGGAFAGSENFNARNGGFVGLTILLAILLAARELPRGMRRGLFVSVVALAVSWKIPPLGWIWKTVPPLELFAAEYAVLVFVLFAALAAGPALEIVAQRRSRTARLAGIGLLAAGLPLVVGGALISMPAGRDALEKAARDGVSRLRDSGYLKAPAETYESRMTGYIDRGASTVRRRYALPGLCWMVAGAALLSRKRQRTTWLLASGAIAELAAFGYGYLPAVPRSAIPATPAAVADLQRLNAAREGLMAASYEAYTADLPTLDGIRDVRSFSLLESGSDISRLASCGYDRRLRAFPEILGRESADCLARLGVRYFVSRAAQPHASRVGGLDPPGVGVYELPDARPPAAAATEPPEGTAAGTWLTLGAAVAAVALMRRAPRWRGPESPRSPAVEKAAAGDAVPTPSRGSRDGGSSNGR